MSTLEIAGYTFPSVALICPPIGPDDPDTEWDRALGYAADRYRYIPAENGLIFEVKPMGLNEGLLALSLLCVACELSLPEASEDPSYLPIWVGLQDGQLVRWNDRRRPLQGVCDWTNAEPEWVAETILRLSTKPFTIPDGPRCRMIPRSAVLEGAP